VFSRTFNSLPKLSAKKAHRKRNWERSEGGVRATKENTGPWEECFSHVRIYAVPGLCTKSKESLAHNKEEKEI